MQTCLTKRSPIAPVLPILLFAVLSGCDRGGGGEDRTESDEVREMAARRACVAAEVDRRAADDVASLEETIASAADTTAGGQLTRRAAVAALEFARAYAQHARLRLGAYAQVDSAYNYSPRAADSTRHVQMARQLSIRAPETGTIEANVVAAYERDLAALAGDPDHPCNWELDAR